MPAWHWDVLRLSAPRIAEVAFPTLLAFSSEYAQLLSAATKGSPLRCRPGRVALGSVAIPFLLKHAIILLGLKGAFP